MRYWDEIHVKFGMRYKCNICGSIRLGIKNHIHRKHPEIKHFLLDRTIETPVYDWGGK